MPVFRIGAQLVLASESPQPAASLLSNRHDFVYMQSGGRLQAVEGALLTLSFLEAENAPISIHVAVSGSARGSTLEINEKHAVLRRKNNWNSIDDL